ncbi:MAG: hypothetical protein ACR2G5_06525 [Pyrinomonadaceae bacterium]
MPGTRGKVATTTNLELVQKLRAELPYLLWLYHMGIILFWIHDSSRKRARTYRLIDHTVDLVDRLVSLASNPLMRPLRKKALSLIDDVREGIPDDLANHVLKWEGEKKN